MNNHWFEVSENNDTVINFIVWDGVSPYLPKGVYLIRCGEIEGMQIGWKKINGVWEKPQPEETTEEA